MSRSTHSAAEIALCQSLFTDISKNLPKEEIPAMMSVAAATHGMYAMAW
jgi:hypothetical protein